VLKPRKLGVVYILSGQKAELLLRIRQGRGRGHLFGTLHAEESRVRIDPSRFGGKKSDISITLDTSNLPISTKTQKALVLIDSSASEKPVAVPFRFKVVSRPVPFTRWVIRPLTGFLFAGLLGAILGALLTKSGAPLPAWMPHLGSGSAIEGWTIVVGVLWGILGGVRGLFQPLSWPVLYALRRCLVRLLTWLVIVGIIAFILSYGWRHTPSLGRLPFGLSDNGVLLSSLIFAIIPAALGEIWNERSTRHSTLVQSEQPLVRPGFLVLLVLLSIMLAFGAMRIGGPFIEKLKQPEISHEIHIWGETHLQNFEQTLNTWVDKAAIRYYDRRAPSHTPTPTPSPEKTDESNS